MTFSRWYIVEGLRYNMRMLARRISRVGLAGSCWRMICCPRDLHGTHVNREGEKSSFLTFYINICMYNISIHSQDILRPVSFCLSVYLTYHVYKIQFFIILKSIENFFHFNFIVYLYLV